MLPREAELQVRFKASRQTVREAIKVLSAKGMVYARKRAAGGITECCRIADLADRDPALTTTVHPLPHDRS